MSCVTKVCTSFNANCPLGAILAIVTKRTWTKNATIRVHMLCFKSQSKTYFLVNRFKKQLDPSSNPSLLSQGPKTRINQILQLCICAQNAHVQQHSRQLYIIQPPFPTHFLARKTTTHTFFEVWPEIKPFNLHSVFWFVNLHCNASIQVLCANSPKESVEPLSQYIFKPEHYEF